MHYLGKGIPPEFFFGDRLSPPPGDRSSRVLFDPHPPPAQEKNWKTEVRRRFREAIENPTWLNDYSFAEHQACADRSPPKPRQRGWRGGPEVRLDADRASVVVGCDGSVGLLRLPRFVNGSSLVNMTKATEQHMRMEFRPADHTFVTHAPKVSRRNAGDVHRHDCGLAGDRHYGIWHARGHQYSDSYEPSRDTTRNVTNLQWSSRIRFFDSNYVVDHRVEYLMELARPDLADMLKAARRRVVDHPGVLPFDAVWHTSFIGRAVIVNRETGEHLDCMGVRRAWDVIIAAGDFEGGDFYFRDMNVRCPFRPGDLVAFDGTSQRHKIEAFRGRLRLSHVYFIHQSVLTELGIDSHLPDVFLSDLISRMARFARRPYIPRSLRPPRAVKRKRSDDMPEPSSQTLKRRAT